MGSGSSKSDNERESQRHQTKREVGQRLYTEDEIQRALAYQKRMFEDKQLKIQTSSGIYPNRQTQNLNTINGPGTSTAVHSTAIYYWPAKPSSTGPSYDTPFSARPSHVTPSFNRSTNVTPSSAGPSHITPSSTSKSHVTPSFAMPTNVTPVSARSLHVEQSSDEPSHVTPSSASLSHVTPSSARPSHVTPFSAIPSHAKSPFTRSTNVTPASVRPSHITPVSAGQLHVAPSSDLLSHVTPSSASPSHVTQSSAGPLHVTPSSAGTTHVTPFSTKPSHVTPCSARPSHNTRFSAIPSHVKPSFTRSTNVTATSVGTTHVTLVSAAPLHVALSSDVLSRVTPSSVSPSHMTPSSAELSHIKPSSAGTSHVEPSSTRPNKRNQKRNQAQQPRSSSRVNQNSRQLSGTVNCVTCNGQLSLHIYQCTNGHSSCDACRFKMARCGNCTEMITDMRNITLESTLADLTINTEGRIKCSNAKDGCCLHFSREQLQKHLKECPFNIISCPVMEFSGDCSWKGTIRQLATHFSDAHPKHREADVNKEMHIVVIELDFKVMHLVNIGFHQFLVQIRLDASLNNIYMVTQYLGTNVSASKWTYEWHVYNKKEPRRKFEYIDICKSNATPVSEIFKNNNCAVINLNYAKTFLDNGKLTFKFYIKKQFESKKNNNATTSYLL